MRPVSAQSCRPSAATSASIIALVAIAMAFSAAQGASLSVLPEQVSQVRETSAARAVAAAVTAAVRDMVGHDTINASVDLEQPDALAWLPEQATSRVMADDVGRSHVPAIAPRLLNIPPPTR